MLEVTYLEGHFGRVGRARSCQVVSQGGSPRQAHHRNHCLPNSGIFEPEDGQKVVGIDNMLYLPPRLKTRDKHCSHLYYQSHRQLPSHHSTQYHHQPIHPPRPHRHRQSLLVGSHLSELLRGLNKCQQIFLENHIEICKLNMLVKYC
jgi:hypothetical protein